jgi:hypothetical protein
MDTPTAAAPLGEAVRDARRRRKRIRELDRERERAEFERRQRAIPPCPRCGRRAGQVAIVDVGTAARAGESDLGAGKPGCELCVDGLPGEYREPGRVHVLRFTDAPTREQLEAEKRGIPSRRGWSPPSYDPDWLEDGKP